MNLRRYKTSTLLSGFLCIFFVFRSLAYIMKTYTSDWAQKAYILLKIALALIGLESFSNCEKSSISAAL